MKRAFSFILSFFMVCCLILQGLSYANAESDANIMKLRFDDHVDLTGKTVEIIEAGEGPVVVMQDNYLVATGVGTAKVRIDDTVHMVIVEKAKINLIMIMGQSNAGNHFANATSDVTCPIGTAYWWGNGQGTAATEPVDYTQPSMGFHTPLLAELYAQSEAAGDPVKNVMIWHEGITSKNGSAISAWAKSATDTSGTNASVTMLENCRAYYQARSGQYEIVGSGVYWLQGESDGTTDPTMYTQCFMAMWQRLKNAGMEYVAFMRVRRNIQNSPANRDDLSHSASLSAQIKMINENPAFYMATTLTENWIGTPTVTHTVDISNYITMMQTYGQSASYKDSYGNTATYENGKLTTTMKSLYGSNNVCHYGKFGYGIIGADAAYNMYRALHGKDVAIVVTDTSGHADRGKVLKNNQNMTLDISEMTENLSFRADCGSASGTLKFVVRSGTADITSGLISIGEKFGSVNVATLRDYRNVSVLLTYTTLDGAAYTAICYVQGCAVEPKKDYIWDFNEDLKARGADGEILNSFLEDALLGSYAIDNGYLTGNGLQLELENAIRLNATRNWSIEWKYGALTNGTAGFLLCEDKGNTVGNRALWHTNKSSFVIADYKDSAGYYNYTSADVIIQAYDCVKLTNSYDPTTGKSTVSLWLNDQLRIEDFQLKGSINGASDSLDMTGYPLVPQFAFCYMGNNGMSAWRVNCQLDYLKVSFDENYSHSYFSEVTVSAACETAGLRTYTCTQCGDSYAEIIPATGHSYEAAITVPTCAEVGYTSYTCGCGDTYIADQVAALGHSFENGICSTCGEADPDYVKPVVQPTLTLKSPTLEFKDMVKVIAFFTAENIDDVVEMGMITYTSKVEEWNVDTADHVIPGAILDESTGRYFASSQGINAKYLGDTVYLACYAKLTDGSYVYTKLAPYSPIQYATSQLKNSSDVKLKQLVAAMLNYGAAAQNYFGHNTDTLANGSLTEEQLALVEAYRDDMVSTVPTVDTAKQGVFANNKGFSKRNPAVSFEGAFSINYFFTPAYTPVDGITLYYWNETDFDVADVLAVQNASGSIAMTAEADGQYRGDLVDIAAKAISQTIYVAAVYSDGTTTWTSGVLGYSIGSYCASLSVKGGTLADLGMATAVYGYHAKQYFG